MAFGIVVLVVGVAWMVVSGVVYVSNWVSATQVCASPNYASQACLTVQALNSLGIFWILSGIGVFLIGLWGLMRVFLEGEDVRAARVASPGRMCPVCSTLQRGQFCMNDGTKLI